MLTAGDLKPKINNLMPVGHIGGQSAQISQRQKNALTTSVDSRTIARPSAMLAIEDSRSVTTKNKNFSTNPHASKTVGAKAGSTQPNHQLGRLPTLGLSKYQAGDFGDETRNPFYV